MGYQRLQNSNGFLGGICYFDLVGRIRGYS